MRVLALQPYDGGSHRAFLDGWIARSRHHFDVLRLPPHHWKWRMRHAAATFAGRVDPAARYDALWCTSMLDLEAFRGLAPRSVAGLPATVYFHENQLTYPDAGAGGRDVHFGLTQMNAALSAIASGGGVWWNSAFNRDSFLQALDGVLAKVPDRPGLEDVVQRIAAGSTVRHPGIDAAALRQDETRREQSRPLRILWAARWERDKDPEAYFAAIDRLADTGRDFRLSVIGEQFGQVPSIFAAARQRHARRIDHWGYQADRAAYANVLRQADVVVSTARHEFFGLAVVEAVAAGCWPVLPRRLSYPELFDDPRMFYDDLADHLVALIDDGVPPPDPAAVQRFDWSHVAPTLDDALAAGSLQ